MGPDPSALFEIRMVTEYFPVNPVSSITGASMSVLADFRKVQSLAHRG